jgi:hypothetical protein
LPSLPSTSDSQLLKTKAAPKLSRRLCFAICRRGRIIPHPGYSSEYRSELHANGFDQRQKGVTLGLSQPAGTNAFRPATAIGKSQIGKHITIERVDRIDTVTRTGDRFRPEKGKRFEDYLKTLP